MAQNSVYTGVLKQSALIPFFWMAMYIFGSLVQHREKESPRKYSWRDAHPLILALTGKLANRYTSPTEAGYYRHKHHEFRIIFTTFRIIITIDIGTTSRRMEALKICIVLMGFCTLVLCEEPEGKCPFSRQISVHS